MWATGSELLDRISVTTYKHGERPNLREVGNRLTKTHFPIEIQLKTKSPFYQLSSRNLQDSCGVGNGPSAPTDNVI